MKFEEVLPALREGKKIRRKDIVWRNYYGFLFISETENKIFSDNVDNYDYKIIKEDLLAEDWEIVKEKKKVKLRDIGSETLVKNIAKWFCAKYSCAGCPLYFVRINKNVTCNDWAKYKDLYSDKFLNQEIEIEEE